MYRDSFHNIYTKTLYIHIMLASPPSLRSRSRSVHVCMCVCVCWFLCASVFIIVIVIVARWPDIGVYHKNAERLSLSLSLPSLFVTTSAHSAFRILHARQVNRDSGEPQSLCVRVCVCVYMRMCVCVCSLKQINRNSLPPPSTCATQSLSWF